MCWLATTQSAQYDDDENVTAPGNKLISPSACKAVERVPVVKVAPPAGGKRADIHLLVLLLLLVTCGVGDIAQNKCKSLQHPVFPGGHPSKY